MNLKLIFGLNFSEQLKTFFLEFVTINDKEGGKVFKYRQQLTKIAHREQISFEIDLDDVQSFEEDLATAIANNTRRYTNLVLNVSIYCFRYIKSMFITTYYCV